MGSKAPGKARRSRDAHRDACEYDVFDDDGFFIMLASRTSREGSSSSAFELALKRSRTTAKVAKRNAEKTPRQKTSRWLAQSGMEASAGDDEYIFHQDEDEDESSRRKKGKGSEFDGWHRLMSALVAAYHQHPSLVDQSRAEQLIRCAHADVDESSLTVFDFSGKYKIRQASCAEDLPALYIRHRLFPASPSQPRSAFSLTLLRLYQALRKHSNVGAYNMSNSMCDLFQSETPTVRLTSHTRRQLAAASTWFQATQVYTTRSLLYGKDEWTEDRPPLCEDDLNLTLQDLADSCPACFYSFVMAASKTDLGDGSSAGEGRATSRPDNVTESSAQASGDREAASIAVESSGTAAAPRTVAAPSPTPPSSASPPQLIVSIDGNFSQKRKKRHNISSRQALPPRRFLSQRQVDKAESDLSIARLVDGKGHHQCSAKVVAGDPEAAKGAMGPHDITGVMGLCCRHDVPLIFCDITSPGERHHYALALLQCLFRAMRGVLHHVGVMYDIGCRFAPNPSIKSVLSKDIEITWTIPLFHVYGHTLACRVQFSPRRVDGMGWTDGEGMERVWSGVSSLVASARSMSQVSRRFHLEERLEHLAVTRRRTLARWITVKTARIHEIQTEALKTLSGSMASLVALKISLGSDLPEDFVPADRLEYFPDADVGIYSMLHYMNKERRVQALARVKALAKARTLAKALQKKGKGRGGTATNASATSDQDEDALDGRERDPDKICGVDVPAAQMADIGPERPPPKKRRIAAEASAAQQPQPEGTGLDEAEATKTLADALWATLANYHMLQAQIRDRKGQRYATDILLQLKTSIAKEKKAAITAMNDLNAHLKDIFANYAPIGTDTLFEEWRRDWASAVATEGSIELPWWTDKNVARIVDAFADLLRVAEEVERLQMERANLDRWIKDRTQEVRARLEERDAPSEAGKRLLEQLNALKDLWTSTPAPVHQKPSAHIYDRPLPWWLPPEAMSGPAVLDAAMGYSTNSGRGGWGDSDSNSDSDYGEDEEDTEDGEGEDDDEDDDDNDDADACGDSEDKTLDPMRAVNDEAFGWTERLGAGVSEFSILARS